MFERVSTLQAVTSGGEKKLLTCLHESKPLTFECWWPHLGIAVDIHAIPDEEEAAKRAWCDMERICYVGPSHIQTDHVWLEQFAAERRRQRMES